jgi:hypothetical protein
MITLDNLIPVYYDDKQNLDFYKKQCDAGNAKIKELMAQQGLKDYEVNGITAKYIVQNKEKMNEEALLKLLKEKGYTDIIKTKEYVDMDALENALYHDEIDKYTVVSMDNCREVQEVIQLRISKKKEK